MHTPFILLVLGPLPTNHATPPPFLHIPSCTVTISGFHIEWTTWSMVIDVVFISFFSDFSTKFLRIIANQIEEIDAQTLQAYRKLNDLSRDIET